MKQTQPKAYAEDLAYIHDAGFGQVARAAAAMLLKELRPRFASGRVADLGCGSGILSLPLAQAGYDMWGLDLSPAMIELARQRVPSGEFHVGSLLRTKLPNFVVVAAVGECVNYLFDGSNSRRVLARFIQRVYAALELGGLFLFDAAGPGRGQPRPVKHFVEGSDWAVLVETVEDRIRRRLTRRIVSFRQVGSHYRRSEETHRLLLHSPAEVLALLRQAGFRATTSKGYGDLPLPRGWTTFLATKPKA